jgi:hypothetical protein
MILLNIVILPLEGGGWGECRNEKLDGLDGPG